MRLVVLRPVFALCVVLASAVSAAAFVRFDVEEEFVDSVSNPQAVALADFDGDSIDDAVVVDVGDFVTVFLNDGNGVLEEDASYDTAEGPVAVATGLFNADAFVDIVAVNSVVGTVTVFYNNGLGTFDDEDPRQFLADVNARGVAVADFNNDGEDDLAVLSPSRIALLQGNGDGTFSAFNPATVQTGSSDSFAIAAGNLDAGINIDLAVSNRANNQVAVFLGAGNGSFEVNQFANAGPEPTGFVIVNATGDGDNDLVSALSEGSTTTEMSLLENDGEGFFGASQLFTGPEFPLAITSLDVEPDGKIDLAATSSEGGEIFVLCQPSDVCPGDAVEAGIWASAVGGAVRGCADGTQVSIVSGKLNNDTRDDFVALKENDDGDIDTLCIALNQSGVGTPPPTTMPTTPGGGATPTPTGPTPTPTVTPTRTLTATPTEIPTIGVGICNTKGESKFPELVRPVAVTIGDFDRNGSDDVAVADTNANQVQVILETFGANDPNMPCNSINVSQLVEVGVAQPEALVTADLDRDGSLDLAVIGSGGLSVFYGIGDGRFTPFAANPITAGTDPSDIALADLNRDFTPDLIVTDSGSSSVSIFMGTRQRPSPFIGPCAMPVQGRTNKAVSTDLNNDGRNDFAVTSPQSRTIGVFLQLASAGLACGITASFQGQSLVAVQGDPTGLLAGTFGAGDTIPDLVVAVTKPGQNGTVQLFEGRVAGSGVTYQAGAETAVPTPTPPPAPNPAVPSAIGRGDIERDGRTDLLITDTGNNTLAQFRGQPSGGLGVPLIPIDVGGDGPVALAVADLDGDGRDDVVIANADDGSLSYLLSDQRAPTPTPTNTTPPTPTNTQATPGTPTETPSITPTATRSRRPSLTPTPVPTNTQRGVVTLSGNGCAIDEDPNSVGSLLLAAFALVPWLMRRQASNSQG